jgi:hypothetical protein
MRFARAALAASMFFAPRLGFEPPLARRKTAKGTASEKVVLCLRAAPICFGVLPPQRKWQRPEVSRWGRLEASAYNNGYVLALRRIRAQSE